jgi:hypothetical protein
MAKSYELKRGKGQKGKNSLSRDELRRKKRYGYKQIQKKGVEMS